MNKIIKKLNPLRKKTISRQFFLNYILLFIMLLIISGLASEIADRYVDYVYESSQQKLKTTYTNIHEYGIEKAFNMGGFEEKAYMELLDYNLKVIDAINSIHEPKYKYDQEKFNIMLSNSYGEFDYYYPEGYEEFLLIYRPVKSIQKRINKIYIIQNIFFVIILLIILLFYVKITANKYIKPINKLVKGVSVIGNGKYDSTISMKCNNELDYLKEEINNMAHKIQQEISLRESMEQNRKQLILHISHDLKTPLTSILGYAETLLEDDELSNEEKINHLNIIINNSKRANNLIQDLFHLSQIENEEFVLNTETCNLCEFTREVLINFIPLLKQTNMEYYFDIPDDKILCKINKEKLDRAFSNIIINSIKYSGENTKLTVIISTESNNALIIIKDNGIGIDEEFTETIFDSFVRTDSARNSKTGGTGLGLAITKKIIEKHNGIIKLDTDEVKGCKFAITLPLT